jgi:hypothetical protein
MTANRNTMAMGAVALAGLAAAVSAPRLMRFARDLGARGIGGTYRDHSHAGPRPKVDPARGVAA